MFLNHKESHDKQVVNMSMFPLTVMQLNTKIVRNVPILAKEREMWVKFSLLLQKILHSQGVCKAAEQRPLRQDFHHAVFQLRHEERSGPAFGSNLFTWSKVSPSLVNICHWMFLISVLSESSLAASDPYRSESVWCSRTGLPQRVGKLFQ